MDSYEDLDKVRDILKKSRYNLLIKKIGEII